MGLELELAPEGAPIFTTLEALTPESISRIGKAPKLYDFSVRAFRARHHSLARALAGGMTNIDAAHATGYVPETVTALLADATFRGLVEHYRKQHDAAYLSVHEKISGLTEDAIAELQHRLETEPESFTPKDLMQLLSVAADRSGNGPTSKKEVDVRVGIGDRLETARRRALAAIREEVIDAEYEELR